MSTRVISIVRESAPRTSVADAWKAAYFTGGGNWVGPGDAKRETYERLVALGPTPHPEQTAGVIGNCSWSYLTCGGCLAYVLTGLRIQRRQPPDADGILMCDACVDAIGGFQE